MIRIRAFVATLAFVSVLAGTAAAQSAAGHWNGKMIFKMPPAPNAEAKTQMQKAAEQIAKLRFALTLGPGKTCKIAVSGMPAGSPMAKDGNMKTGTWTQAGSTVTMTLVDPKTKKAETPQKLMLSKDAKTLTLTLPTPSGQGSGSIVFTKG